MTSKVAHAFWWGWPEGGVGRMVVEHVRRSRLSHRFNNRGWLGRGLTSTANVILRLDRHVRAVTRVMASLVAVPTHASLARFLGGGCTVGRHGRPSGDLDGGDCRRFVWMLGVWDLKLLGILCLLLLGDSDLF